MPLQLPANLRSLEVQFTAFCFAARYYWAEKKDLSEYYSRVAVGLCQQLLQEYAAKEVARALAPVA